MGRSIALSTATMVPHPRRRPHSIFSGGFSNAGRLSLWQALRVRWPASENLHRNGLAAFPDCSFCSKSAVFFGVLGAGRAGGFGRWPSASLCEFLQLPPSVIQLFFQPDLHVGSRRGDPMRRRNLLFGLLAVATLRSARAEQSRKANRIAIALPAQPVTIISEAGVVSSFRAFFNELRRLGYVEGDNLLIERFSGEGRAFRYPDLAQDVVSRKPDVIISSSTFLTLDFKAATTTIPIVGLFSYPVELGVVSSLARPGGNVTGVAFNIGEEQWDKRVQLLRQVVPHLTKLAVLETREVRDVWEADMPDLMNKSASSRRWGVSFVGPPLNHPVNEAEY